MPIYEYKCEGCQHTLEAIQKVADAPLRECPACGAARLKRLMSAGGFQLKGTGWYATDFKQGGGKNKNKEDKGEKKTDTPESNTPPKKASGGGSGSSGGT